MGKKINKNNCSIFGHVCSDIVNDRYVPGGTALYASITAQNLDVTPRLVTSCGFGYPFSNHLPKDLVVVPAEKSTVFQNTYRNGSRSQRLFSLASRITVQDIPESWKNSDMALVSPIAGEVDFNVIEALSSDVLVCVCPQGWLRTWDSEGNVSRRQTNSFNWDYLRRADVIIISEEDIGGNESALTNIINGDNITIITRAEKGSSVFLQGGERHDISAIDAKVVDECGAGDVFAMAFLVRFHSTGDWRRAAQFASAAAACSVEGEAIYAIPALQQVEARMNFINAENS
ncbi:MAG: PfkB family carbohydrate kinase [bacterium]|nr:PfkB family carbohydrate kinase [bacterium]